jgi:hypothetical protein
MKPNLLKSIFLTSVVVTALSGVASAAFDKPDDAEIAAAQREKMLDVTVTQFKKDGTSGTVFEFTPVTIPGVRCVSFHFGSPAGVQCFPAPPSPKP